MLQFVCSESANISPFLIFISTSCFDLVSQCVAVTVLQYVAVCCSVLQIIGVCCSVLYLYSVLPCIAMCCSVLPFIAVCCSTLQCVGMRCSVCSDMGPVTLDQHSLLRYACNNIFLCVPTLLYMHARVCIHMHAKTHSHTWRYWIRKMCCMSPSYKLHASFVCVTRCIHMCDMIPSDLDGRMCDIKSFTLMSSS